MNFPEVPGGVWSFYLSNAALGGGTLYLTVGELQYRVPVDDPTPENILAAAPLLVAGMAKAEVERASYQARAAALSDALGIEVSV